MIKKKRFQYLFDMFTSKGHVNRVGVMHRCPIAEIPVYAYMISLEAEIEESD